MKIEQQVLEQTQTRNYEQFRPRRNSLARRDRMIKKHLPLVKNIAAALASRTSPNVDYEDLVSIGVFGLIDAVKNFDENKNVKFSSYCKPRIHGAMIDELRQLDWVPRLTRQRNKMLKKATSALKSKLDRHPSQEELAAELGLNSQQFHRMRKDADPTSMLSLDSLFCSQDDTEDAQVSSVIANDKSHDPTDLLQQQDTRDYIMKNLDPTERWVIMLYYYENLSMRQIGKMLNITEGRVSQIHSKIIQKLRTRMSRTPENFTLSQ